MKTSFWLFVASQIAVLLWIIIRARNARPAACTYPEEAMQERFSLVAWITFHALAVWVWLATRHECSWCHGYMSGNPISRRISHHICPRCLAAQKDKISRERKGATVSSRSTRTLLGGRAGLTAPANHS